MDLTVLLKRIVRVQYGCMVAGQYSNVTGREMKKYPKRVLFYGYDARERFDIDWVKAV